MVFMVREQDSAVYHCGHIPLPGGTRKMTRDLATSNGTSGTSDRLRWGRIIGGAFLLELVLVIVLVPPLQMLGPDKVIPFVYPACSDLRFRRNVVDPAQRFRNVLSCTAH
jgi:hypothetical protein